jgi:hypothetical protein
MRVSIGTGAFALAALMCITLAGFITYNKYKQKPQAKKSAVVKTAVSVKSQERKKQPVVRRATQRRPVIARKAPSVWRRRHQKECTGATWYHSRLWQRKDLNIIDFLALDAFDGDYAISDVGYFALVKSALMVTVKKQGKGYCIQAMASFARFGTCSAQYRPYFRDGWPKHFICDGKHVHVYMQ